MSVCPYDYNALEVFMGNPSAQELADRMGLKARQIRIYRSQRWLSAMQADKLAGRVGATPWDIWGQDWESDESALLTREQIEWDEAHERMTG